MKAWLMYLIFISLSLESCRGQTKVSSQTQQSDKIDTTQLVGETFENSEFTYYGIPKNISPTDTSSGWKQKGQKILLTGMVYQQDGKTPAPDVLLYYYHTNTEGRYLHKPEEKRSMPPNELGQTHGYIRGWVKTDAAGKYFIYTVRPGTYPTNDEPAHIHVTIKEPNEIKEYYIDAFVFDDDRLLTGEKRKALENRGGSGILRLVDANGLWVAEHNIILGVNIPNYPRKITSSVINTSGLQIGEDNPSFIPFHAWGPDKGTRTCPVCKYGRYHGIVYFVGNNPDWADIKKWLKFLEQESIKRNKYLKAYFVYGNDTGYSKQKRQEELENIGKELGLKSIALTYVPSMTDTQSEVNLNKINPSVKNTFVIYRHRSIIDKYINLEATEPNFKLISTVLDQTVSDYFQFSEPKHD